jgi:hypothetical protein
MPSILVGYLKTPNDAHQIRALQFGEWEIAAAYSQGSGLRLSATLTM